MIGACAAMGFGPADIRGWSMWEYRAVVAGWNAANSPEGEEAPPAPDPDTHRSKIAEAKAKNWFN